MSAVGSVTGIGGSIEASLSIGMNSNSAKGSELSGAAAKGDAARRLPSYLAAHGLYAGENGYRRHGGLRHGSGLRRCAWTRRLVYRMEVPEKLRGSGLIETLTSFATQRCR